MEIAPYLSAIQSLNGQTPGEKYKSLHSIAIQIIQNEDNKKAFLESGFNSHVQPALLPFLRILVGNKLKLKNVVIEALKSDDVVIVEQALRSKWFFNANNEYIRVNYFLKKVMPFVSLRTRRRLVKTLARHLASHPKKADDFFTGFVELYGLHQTLPILMSCTEQFILNTIFERRILLSNKNLQVLYRRYPALVVRYLQLGNEKNGKNLQDRKVHTIDVKKYFKLLPIIVKHYTQDFVEIYESLSSWYDTNDIKIGSTRAKFVLSNSTDLLIQKAELVFKTMPLKIIGSKLSAQQFETIFGNLFPKDVDELSVYDMIYHLRYYPEEKKFPLLRDKYKLAYGTDILNKQNIHQTTELFRILPLHIKEEFGKRVLESHRGSSEYYEFVDHLPPREAILIMKERIAKTGSAHRISCIQTMITSCSYYNSKDDLLEVLQYFHVQCKDEPAEVFFRVMQKLMQQFSIEELDKPCWGILMDFTQKFYVKGDLYNSQDYLYWGLFHGGLLFFVKECQKDPVDEEMKQWLDKFMAMLLNCYLEHDMKVDPLPFHDCSAKFKRNCLEKYLISIPILYPENHAVWDKFRNKLALVSYLVKSIDNYDFKELCQHSMKKYNLGITVGGKTLLRVRDYPWLTKFALDLLKEGDRYSDSEDTRKYHDLKESLKRHDLPLYESFAHDDTEFISNLDCCDAMRLIKRDHRKILNKWKLYLNVCRKKLQENERIARKFVNASKWHQDLPINFVDQCLLEIEDAGSILVLGLLLDGEAFGKIVQRFIPKDKKIDLTEENAKMKYRYISSLIKSMNHVNPPMSFEKMFSYCQSDYVSLVCDTLINTAQRIPVDRVVAFANQLTDKSVPIKKLGIRLVCQVSSYAQLGEFLIHLLDSATNHSIRPMVAKIIWKAFKQTPSRITWELTKVCIDDLTSYDQAIFEKFIKVDDVNNDFVSQYLRELLKKINELEDDVRSKLVDALVYNLIDTTIVNFISDDVLVDLIKKNFFECDSRFMMTAYLFNDQKKFDKRMKTLLDIVREKFEEYNKPHPKQPRYFPIKLQFHQFLLSITSYVLCRDKCDMSRKLINASLDLVSEKLELHEEPRVFMCLYLVKDYMESSTPQEFGIKCAATARRLVEALGSEMILNDIGEYVERMMCNVYVYPGNGLLLRMATIEGLTQVDERLAALIGIKLLTCHDACRYDDRYDEYFRMWSSMKDPMVLAALNNFRNQVRFRKKDI